MIGTVDLGHFLFFGRLCLGFGGHVFPLCKRDRQTIRIAGHGKMRECGVEDRSEGVEVLHELGDVRIEDCVIFSSHRNNIL